MNKTQTEEQQNPPAKTGVAGVAGEHILYLLTVAVVPSIPLFYLYGQNTEHGVLFSHALIFGVVLAVVSLILHLLLSKLLLCRRRSVFFLTISWFTFWLFVPLMNVVKVVFPNLARPRLVFTVCLLIILVICAFLLRRMKHTVNKSVANIISITICILFLYNFIPAVLTDYTHRRAALDNIQSGELPFEIKTEFVYDEGLPSPNIYWLHMDSMVGFSAVDKYFSDPQAELIAQLAERGFVINESAHLGVGFTMAAVPAMTSPVFYDSYFADELYQVADLFTDDRKRIVHASMREKGIDYYDFDTRTELFKALSGAGYFVVGDESLFPPNNDDVYLDMWIQGLSTVSVDTFKMRSILQNNINEFIDLITATSALSLFERHITELVNELIWQDGEWQLIPEYTEVVNTYTTGSDSDHFMEHMVRIMEHTTSFPQPFIIFHMNDFAHCSDGEVQAFLFDENGNAHHSLDDPLDVALYLPQHKYTVKTMMAQVDTILKNDPDAVIIIQADHGIHGAGPFPDYYNSEFMLQRGYSHDDQLYLLTSVMSAVRVPPQYGYLTQPLDPLDITRWLVNNFVGDGNYEYLFYEQESNP